jgi:hypothetical protein
MTGRKGLPPVFFLHWDLSSFPGAAAAEELPVPTLKNSLIVSIEHMVTDAAEVEYIKNNFPWGLYAWLSFSKTVVVPNLAWKSDWNDADAGIQAFKNEVNNLMAAAENAGVFLHPVLCSGLARWIWIYRDAKIEDIRNAQWYNDNKIASDDQALDSRVLDRYVFGTLSRYARKMRRNLEAKAQASVAFLRQRMTEKPHVLAAISGWGEVELNFGRLNPDVSVQEWFCDYSPFAVLEFRDWIRHIGMYDEATGKYKGEGWAAGGTRYQGTGDWHSSTPTSGRPSQRGTSSTGTGVCSTIGMRTRRTTSTTIPAVFPMLPMFMEE